MGCRELQIQDYFSFIETEVRPQNDFRFVGNDKAESIPSVRRNEFKHSSAFSASSADTYYTTIDGGTPEVKNTTYLIDPSNFTGYAQVLEETVNGTLAKSYTLGDDVLSQSSIHNSSFIINHFLYDGHGSTRLLTSDTSTITARYNYDAYGKNLFSANTTSPASTDMLYSGEQFDPNLQMQYLRARYYNQNNGRFNRLDPFSGNNYDPQSLHKYAYAHSNPVLGVDPTGMYTLVERLAVSVIQNFLISRVSSVIGTVLNTFAGKLIPPSWYEKMSGFPTAAKLGFDTALNLGKIKGVGIRGGGGFELLSSLSYTNKLNFNCALYGYLQAGASFSNKKASFDVGINLGFVWNADTSDKYTGDFFGISFQYRYLPKYLRAKIRNDLFRLSLRFSNLKPTFALIDQFRNSIDSTKLLEVAKGHMINLQNNAYSSRLNDQEINISAWGSVVAFSLTSFLGGTIGGKWTSTPLKATYQKFSQIYPNHKVKF